MSDLLHSKLVQAALSKRLQAYAPYSKFLVGAAVLTEDGSVFTGTNVENASYGLTICAERVAAAAAVAAGHRKLKAVAVATAGGASPCGACRQFLAEFGGSMDVLLVDAELPEKVKQMSLADLLPEQFELSGESGKS
jgi:cytidine deaminase